PAPRRPAGMAGAAASSREARSQLPELKTPQVRAGLDTAPVPDRAGRGDIAAFRGLRRRERSAICHAVPALRAAAARSAPGMPAPPSTCDPRRNRPVADIRVTRTRAAELAHAAAHSPVPAPRGPGLARG